MFKFVLLWLKDPESIDPVDIFAVDLFCVGVENGASEIDLLEIWGVDTSEMDLLDIFGVAIFKGRFVDIFYGFWKKDIALFTFVFCDLGYS